MWWLVIGVLISAIIFIYFRNSNNGAKEVLPNLMGKSVFISGCDSGMGYGLANKLDRMGLKVFAGCLTPEGASHLRDHSSSSLQTIICDITNEDDVLKAARIVEEASPEGLWALVNNAGVGYGGEWEWFPMKYIRKMMDINFFGHVAVTKAFLPQIKKAKGRIVNTISAGGIIALPGVGPYSSSKFAMEAFSDSLRREMKKWGVTVYIVEPGLTNTPMATNGTPQMKIIWNEVEDRFKAEYPTFRTQVGGVPTFGCFLHNLLPTHWMDFILAKNDQLPIPAVLAGKN